MWVMEDAERLVRQQECCTLMITQWKASGIAPNEMSAYGLA